MALINIIFSRFSAFYSPLISTIAGGFLNDEGLEPTHEVATPERSARACLADGSAHVAQSAVSASWSAIEQGVASDIVHFAQVNEKDGFFVTAREPDPEFTWDNLAGRQVLVDHGGQPLAMFKYAVHRMGVDYGRLEAVDGGRAAAMDEAFRAGQCDYIHQQGPAPQQLESDGVGHIVASVGEAIGPCAFSSLSATREWLESDVAKAFTRAYTKARRYVNEAPAAEIAAAEARYFPDIGRGALESTIAAYQRLGCWNPAVAIDRAAYEVTLDVFEHNGRITKRHAYDDVVVPPPAVG